MSRDVMKLALEALEEITDEVFSPYDNKLGKAIIALREALADQPAQQEPKIDIYRSFEQWKSGNVLEHGVPRTEHYSEAQLDLVEMGWNYGYDAGRAVEQALDKMAENARELGIQMQPAQQEPVALAHKHINATLAAFGPGEAISMTKETWAKLREAMSVLIEQTPQREPVVLKWQQAPIQTAWGDDMVVASIAIDKDHTLSLYCERDQTPKVDAVFAQRTWVGLTDEEKRQIFEREDYQGWLDYINAIEAKLRSKNEDRN